MAVPYWRYETSIGNETSISFRASNKPEVGLQIDYDELIKKFINKYRHRIIFENTKNENSSNGLRITTFYLDGREPIEFENKHQFNNSTRN